MELDERTAQTKSTDQHKPLAATQFTTALNQALSAILARYRWMAAPLGIALVVRVLLIAIAAAAVARVSPAAYSDPLHIWLQKDAAWYIRIARDGYFYLPTDQSSVCFFPLFPLAIRLAHPFAALVMSDRDTSYLLAGMAVSWLAFAAASVVLYRLAWERFGQRAALAVVLLLAAYPFGWYFGTAFSESLYLLLVAVAFLGVWRRNWWLAGLAAGLAGASRPPGLILGGCVAVAYVLDWLRTRHPLRWDALALALAPLGTVAYLAYCWLAFGTPTAYLRTSYNGWHRGGFQLGGVQQAWQLLTQPADWLGGKGADIRAFGLYSILLVLVLASVIPIARRLGPAEALFTLASVLSPLLAFDTVESLGRYISVIVPVFLFWGYLLWRHPVLLRVLVSCCAILLVIFAACFAAHGGLA